MSNVSSDLLWEIVRHNNAYLVKRPHAGGQQFSRDPFNLTNKHSKKHAGFVNEKAVSLQMNDKGGISLATKKSKDSNKPASHHNTHSYRKGTAGRKTYKNVASAVGKNSYRSDLNESAVARASALQNSQRVKKDKPAPKLRGSKAKKAEA